MSDTQTAAIPALIIKRTFNASRERVFSAFTGPDLLSQWFGAPNMKVGEITFDARKGGRYRIAMTAPDGEAFNVGGVISEFRAPEHIAYSFRWEEDDKSAEIDTFVSIDFIDRGKQTEIVMTHTGLASDESRTNHEFGWNAALDALSPIL
jgi:glutathione S-transferase